MLVCKIVFIFFVIDYVYTRVQQKKKKRNEELNTVQYNATIVDQLPSV